MPWRDRRSMTPGRPGRVSRRQARAARGELAVGGLSHREQRRLRSITRTRDIADRRRKQDVRHTAVAVIGGVIAMAVVGAAFALGPAIDAARGEGTSGTFTVSYQQCSRRVGCTWVGTFQSTGGEVVPDVAYDGSLPARALAGARVLAIYAGGSQVYARHSSHAWLFDLVLMVLIGTAVAVLLWISPIGLGKL
jgi:hypothetical protein